MHAVEPCGSDLKIGSRTKIAKLMDVKLDSEIIGRRQSTEAARGEGVDSCEETRQELNRVSVKTIACFRI